jgi:hypothetical protein
VSGVYQEVANHDGAAGHAPGWFYNTGEKFESKTDVDLSTPPLKVE